MPKTYTAAGTAVAGQVYTAAAHNVIATNVNNFIVPPMCQVKRTTTQAITTASVTDVLFNAETFDTDDMHSTTSNTDRITVNTAGVYIVTGNLQMAGNATGVRGIYIRKNGSTFARFFVTAVDALNLPGLSASAVITASAGDYFTCSVYQNSGGNLDVLADDPVGNLATTFSAVWIGRTS